MSKTDYSEFTALMSFGAALSVGLTNLASGISIGVIGEVGVRCNTLNPKIFTALVLVLVFASALGLYGLLVAVILVSKWLILFVK